MIQAIQQLQGALGGVNERDYTKSLTGDLSFTDSLEAAKNMLDTVNQAESVTNQLTYDFITGKNDNIHSLMIAQEKSSVLLQFTMQVRNQLLDAYKEIMRLPI